MPRLRFLVVSAFLVIRHAYHVEIGHSILDDTLDHAEVIGMVEGIIKDGMPDLDVIRVADYKESRYDKESKTRHGLCMVHARRVNPLGIAVATSFPVAFKVRMTDQKK